MNRHADEDRIAGELSAIQGLTRGELIGLWEKAHGRPPPKGLSRRLLEYSAAYRVQVKAFGGLKPMVRRKLRARAASGERTSKSTPAPCRSRALSPGAGHRRSPGYRERQRPQFIVLDELHTYRGRQGADVAILVRRLRDRCTPDITPICIGTSATMASEGNGDRRALAVSEAASRLFGVQIGPDAVVVPCLAARNPFQNT